jgi:hypothetical protein
MTDYSKFKVASAFQHLDPTHGIPRAQTVFVDPLPQGWTPITAARTMRSRADDGTPSYLDVIILAIIAYKSRTHFGDDDEARPNAPICASLKGDVPDPGVSVPQSKTCGTCPNAEWVVRPNGRSKPSCQQHFRAAVLLIPSTTKNLLGAPLIEPVFFKIPPGSHKSWDRYKNEMIHAGIPLASA